MFWYCDLCGVFGICVVSCLVVPEVLLYRVSWRARNVKLRSSVVPSVIWGLFVFRNES